MPRNPSVPLPAADPAAAATADRQWHWHWGDVRCDAFAFHAKRGFGDIGQLGDQPSYEDFVDIFFTEEDFLGILEETNRYARIQKASRQDIVRSRFKDWPEEGITLGDLKLFFSLTVAMG